MFGVGRRSVMCQTKLHAPFDGGDNLAIVEMALRGRVVQLERLLFYHREHSGRLFRQAPSARVRYAMIDPSWSGRVPFPVINLGYQYATAVQRAPLSPIDKLRCWAQLTGWLRVNWVRILRTLARGSIEYLRIGLSRIRNLLRRLPGRHLGSDRRM
jgi:hypothetical protein